jgi:RES domain-containing protein
MIVYRIGRTKYARDLTGEGARLNGGRWNHKLTPCIYTSESRSLAVLEYTVNINIDDIPRALSITTLEVSDKKILELSIVQLPRNWREAPAPASAKDLVTPLLKELKYPVLKIPSAVIPNEYNYLLNPLHSDRSKFLIVDVQDFVYDVRIKNI